jgi:hypothetical protein
LTCDIHTELLLILEKGEMVPDGILLLDPITNLTESAKQFCQDIIKIKHMAACRSYSS